MLELLKTHDARSPAIVNGAGGSAISYGQLADRIAIAAGVLRQHAGNPLILHSCTQTPDSIVLYLACLEARRPVCLLAPDKSTPVQRILETYRPGLMLFPADAAVPACVRNARPFPGSSYKMCEFEPNELVTAPHPDLALLLTTSGSTGTPKLVRLSLTNVLANARSIASYLDLKPGERSIQGLPMHYSYGLSLINSHLVSGGTVVLTPHSFFVSDFWRVFDETQCTSFAGVPYMYETLCSLQFDPSLHPSLRALTQAGGGLRRDLISSLHERTRGSKVRFFVMYGQTEATARISYVPPPRLGEKIGSIGIAIPGGRMELAQVDDLDACELVYSGPNVMLGYADCCDSLARGDELNGVLHTGDLVEQDSDGFFYLTGRLQRFAKLFGRRISLADVEEDLEVAFPIRVAAMECDQQLRIFIASEQDVDSAAVSSHVARALRVPPKFITIDAVDAIPLTASGKKDYKALSS
jgi:acyl-CoA synthetase (AMP-forming)/AMP-acid ligase II